MDIVVTGDGRFCIGMLAQFHCEYIKDDNTMRVWSERAFPINITTSRGTFIEAVDKDGTVIQEGGDAGLLYVMLSNQPLTLRVKKLADPQLSAAQIEEQRQDVTRYLVSDNPRHLDIPDTLPGAIEWMQTQLMAIPENCRDSSQFEFGTTSEYGDTYPLIEITYREPETDAEVVNRIMIGRERVRISEVEERAKLKTLQEKYAET
jgi:hypothetical protein